MMRRWRKILLVALGSLAVLVVALAAGVYLVSERKLNAHYPVPAGALELKEQSLDFARGEHLVRAVVTCTLCHGADLGGAVFADMGAIGVVAGPNLTRGRGGVGADFARADWVRAVRYGIHPDGRSLIAMPSEVFTNISNADLAAMIAYLSQIPAVDREVPRSHFGPLGRALLATGRLNILVAPKTHHSASTEQLAPATPLERGRYIADISGCHGCHGHGLSGGPVAGPPGLPPAANLTPTGLGAWTRDDFVRAMRTGKRPDASPINEFMPWRVYAAMTDAELDEVWTYLRSVPPKASGGK